MKRNKEPGGIQEAVRVKWPGSANLFQAIFENCPEGLYLVDREGRVRAVNRSVEAITGWKREEIVGRECLGLFACRHEKGDPICREDCPANWALGHPGLSRKSDLLLRTRQGEEIVVSVSYTFLSEPGESGKKKSGYALGVMKEITSRKKAEQVFRIQAITDALTGLFNFRFFQQQLSFEVKRSKRYGHPLSLIMLDIDYFKHYNDLHGHPRGNAVLKQIAVILRLNTRETNTVARYGGEEFAVLMPETHKKVAVQAARRLCSLIEEADFPFQDRQPGGSLTVSVGVATYPEDASHGEGLVEFADHLLYRAKRGGRNRVISSNGPESFNNKGER